MAINKLKGQLYSAIAKVDGVLKSAIDKITGQEAAAAPPSSGYVYFRFQGVDASLNPTASKAYIKEVYMMDYWDGKGNDYTNKALTSTTSDANWTVSSGAYWTGYEDWKAFQHNELYGWWSLGNGTAANNWLQIKSETGAIDPKSFNFIVDQTQTDCHTIKVMGSNTGAFSGEETTIGTITGFTGSGNASYVMNIGTPSYDVKQTNLFGDWRIQADNRNHLTKVIDYSGNDRHLTMTGTYGVTLKEGVYCGQGDGVDDRAYYSNTNPSVNVRGEGYTLEYWVLHDNAVQTQGHTVGLGANFKGQKNHLVFGYVLGTNHATTPGAQVMKHWDTTYTTSLPMTTYNSSAEAAAYLSELTAGNPSDPYVNNTWTHYAWSVEFTTVSNTYDTVTMKGYKNGVLEDDYRWAAPLSGTSSSGSISNTATTGLMASATYNCSSTYPNEWGIGFFGGSYQKVYYYNDGYVGESRAYRGALTAAEVLSNFNATKSRYGL